jgi:hypothetical protein
VDEASVAGRAEIVVRPEEALAAAAVEVAACGEDNARFNDDHGKRQRL